MFFSVAYFKSRSNHRNKHPCLFGSVVAVAFQNAFRAEMHQNNVFLFFKNYF
jgi:hypothetical protein